MQSMTGRAAAALASILLSSAATAAAAEPPAVFKDAIAAWHLADARDSAGDGDSALTAQGAVRLGVRLEGGDREASLARGGDGMAAEFTGGHLLAGRGAGGELNPRGAALTVLVRLRDPSGKWDTSLFSKHGGHDKLVYNLFTVDLPSNGRGTDLGFELGTDRGMFQVKLPVADLGPPDGWHDVIARYDGRRGRLELFIDGVLVDGTSASGELRQGNAEPCVVGGESSGGKVIRPFRGLIDHAALWGRALSDEEVVALSGGATAVEHCKREAAKLKQRREQAAVARLATDAHRPAYHFVPPKNWMNDPNGLVQFKGKYHLFYQYNPSGAEWGNMTWGHAVSTDLVRWRHLPHALHPDRPYDDDGVFSGCVVNNDGTAVALYTGTQPEVQCVAIAKDDELRTWEKHATNPVIPRPPPGVELTGFRDPCVWKEPDGNWYMVLGSGIKGGGGALPLYRSKDLVKWDFVHMACEGERDKTGHIWECPNLFPLDAKREKWLLVVSPIPFGRAIYFVGTWKDLKFTPESQGEIDTGGSLYAPQLFRDERGRLILFGWLREDRAGAAAAGWQGAQSLPRVVSLGDNGRVRFEPAEEVATLRGGGTERADVEVKADADVPLEEVHTDRVEVLAEVEPGGDGPCGVKVLASPGGEEQTLVVYDRKSGKLTIDRSRSSIDSGPAKEPRSARLQLAPGEPLRLRVFVDRSVVEVYANGHTCLTSRVYPARKDSLGVGVFSRGGAARVKSLSAWEVQAANTPAADPGGR